MSLITILLYLVSILTTIYGLEDAAEETTRLVKIEKSTLPTPVATSARTFEDLINQGNMFIDKTLFIKELITCRDEYPMRVVARPKGWGKTVNLRMLESFFGAELDEISYKVKPRNQTKAFELFEQHEIVSPDEEPRKLDQPLLITKHYPQLVQKHQGVYPVIYMDFSGMTGRYSMEFEVEMLTRLNSIRDKYDLRTMVEVLRASGKYIDQNVLKILDVMDSNASKSTMWTDEAAQSVKMTTMDLRDITDMMFERGGNVAEFSAEGNVTMAAEKYAGLRNMMHRVEKQMQEKEAAKKTSYVKVTKVRVTQVRTSLDPTASTVSSKRKKFRSTWKYIPGIRIIDLDRAEELEKEGNFATEPDIKVTDSPKMFKNDTEMKVAWAKRLKCMCNFLYLYFNHKPIILIDNYDDPFIQAMGQPGVLRRQAAMRSMWQFYELIFGKFENDTRFYSLLVVSGQMRIALPGLMRDFEREQSGKSIHHHGFHEEEVKAILNGVGIPEALRSQAMAYYGGYQFSEYEYNMFNPSSIASFVANKQAKRYINSNGTLDRFLAFCIREPAKLGGLDEVPEHICMRVLHNAGHIIKDITELDLKHFSAVRDLSGKIERYLPSTVAALCYAAGYITLDRHTSSEEAFGEVELRIPNQEIRDLMISKPEFEDIIYKESDEQVESDGKFHADPNYDDGSDVELITVSTPKTV